VRERILLALGWLAAAALSAYACGLAAIYATPIDRALPLLGVLATLAAWATYPALMLAVPLLIAASMSLPNETTRLLAFGAVLAVTFGVAVASVPRFLGSSVPREAAPRNPRNRGTEEPSHAAPLLTILILIALRWIPVPSLYIRETLLLLLALTIVFVLGRTPLAIAVAVIAVLVTPAVPLRTLVVPLAVLFVGVLARLFGAPALRLTAPSVAAIAFALTFFAWSGIVARAFPYFLRSATPQLRRAVVDQALGPNASTLLDVPDGAQALIVSGANVPRLRSGALLGRIDPGGTPVRIGDAADWGYLRREHYYGSRNPLPRDPAGLVRGYGYEAWLDGAGRLPLPRGARVIRVTADASLPKDAALQVVAFEMKPQ
jgi:hypothetical protein